MASQWRQRLPRSRIGRLLLGCALIFLGLLGFLPILGFWMIPLGLFVLSVDFPGVRRWRRQTMARIERWRRRRSRRATP